MATKAEAEAATNELVTALRAAASEIVKGATAGGSATEAGSQTRGVSAQEHADTDIIERLKQSGGGLSAYADFSIARMMNAAITHDRNLDAANLVHKINLDSTNHVERDRTVRVGDKAGSIDINNLVLAVLGTARALGVMKEGEGE